MRKGLMRGGLTKARAAGCALGAGLLWTAAAQAQQISDDVVRIGVLSDMSGLYADTAGRGSVEAAKMAVADFGGQVLGRKIEVVWADHQNKADVGATHARTWFDRDGVDLIVDINNTAVAIAVNNLARERGKMVINTGGASDILTNEHCAPTAIHYTYDSYALANGAVRGILAQGKKDWFILGVDYAFGKAMTANVTDFLKDGGGKLVGTTFHPLNASDFSSFLLQAQASKASVINLANATSDTVNAIKAAREFGLTQGGHNAKSHQRAGKDIADAGANLGGMGSIRPRHPNQSTHGLGHHVIGWPIGIGACPRRRIAKAPDGRMDQPWIGG